MKLEHLIFSGLLLIYEATIYLTENKFLRGSIVREKSITIHDQKIQPKTARLITASILILATLITTTQITSITYFFFCIFGEYAICTIDRDSEELSKFKLKHRIFTINTLTMLLIISVSQLIANHLGKL